MTLSCQQIVSLLGPEVIRTGSEHGVEDIQEKD